MWIFFFLSNGPKFILQRQAIFDPIFLYQACSLLKNFHFMYDANSMYDADAFIMITK